MKSLLTLSRGIDSLNRVVGLIVMYSVFLSEKKVQLVVCGPTGIVATSWPVGSKTQTLPCPVA